MVRRGARRARDGVITLIVRDRENQGKLEKTQVETILLSRCKIKGWALYFRDRTKLVGF